MNPAYIKEEDSPEQDWFLSQTEDGEPSPELESEGPEPESETSPGGGPSNEGVPEIICIKEEDSEPENEVEPSRTLLCSLQDRPAPYAPQRPKTLTPRERKRKFTRRELSVIVQGVLAKTEALFGKNKEALAVRKRVWQDMANQVNALGGPCKRTWHDVQKRFYMYRMGVKQKALALRSAQRGGGGTRDPPGQDLTPMTLEEVRILATWSASALEKGRDGSGREQPFPQAASSSSTFLRLPAPPLHRPDPEAEEESFPSNSRTPPGMAPPPPAPSSTPQPRPCPRGAGIPQKTPHHHLRGSPSTGCGRLYSHSPLPSQTAPPGPAPHPPSGLNPSIGSRPLPAPSLRPAGPQPPSQPSLDALTQVQASLSQLLQGQAEQARGAALMQQRMEGHMASMANSVAVLAAVLPDVVRALEGLGATMGKLAGGLLSVSPPLPPAAAAVPPQVSSSGQSGGPRMGYSAAKDSEFRSVQQ